MLCAIQGSRNLNESTLICGGVTGHIYVWYQQKITNVVNAHETSIYSICKLMQGYASVSKDGLIKVWSNNFSLLKSFNVLSFSPRPDLSICNLICCNTISSKLLVGLRGSEVYEISLPTNTHMLLMAGHSHKQLHGLATNPVNADEYVTIGDDGILRMWSIRKKTCLKRIDVGFCGRAITWSLNGSFIVCGLGGNSSSAAKDGGFVVFNAKTLDILFEDRKAKKYITDIKYSPDNTFLAIASYDGKVYLHNSVTYNLVKELEAPSKNCGILKVDFSFDSKIIRLATSLNELLFFTVADSELILSPNATRDIVWYSTTVPYSWLTQGACRPFIEGVSILALALNPSKNMIAVSYQSGEVKLFNYPCQTLESKSLTLGGIATQATKLLFTDDNQYLLLLDSYQRAIIQYKLTGL